jgi:hypothetical protein
LEFHFKHSFLAGTIKKRVCDKKNILRRMHNLKGRRVNYDRTGKKAKNGKRLLRADEGGRIENPHIETVVIANPHRRENSFNSGLLSGQEAVRVVCNPEPAKDKTLYLLLPAEE